jgi:hypothetical protein
VRGLSFQVTIQGFSADVCDASRCSWKTEVWGFFVVRWGGVWMLLIKVSNRKRTNGYYWLCKWYELFRLPYEGWRVLLHSAAPSSLLVLGLRVPLSVLWGCWHKSRLTLVHVCMVKIRNYFWCLPCLPLHLNPSGESSLVSTKMLTHDSKTPAMVRSKSRS